MEGTLANSAAAEGAAAEGAPVVDGQVEPAAARTAASRRPHRVAWGWACQFVRFATVGLTSTALELALYNVLLAVHPTRSTVTLVVYSTFGVLAAIINSYFWNSRWAFRASAVHHGPHANLQRLLFVLQSGANIGINDGVVALMAPFLLSQHFLPAYAASNLAKVAAMSCASVFSFVALREVVFRAHPGGPAKA